MTAAEPGRFTVWTVALRVVFADDNYLVRVAVSACSARVRILG
jgi:hypothetical protein